MTLPLTRRQALRALGCGAAVSLTGRSAWSSGNHGFEISLSERSLQRRFESRSMAHLDFAGVARRQFGIRAVEYASAFFPDDAENKQVLAEMNKQAADHGVRQLLIRVTGEGHIGDPDPGKRRAAVQAHVKWIDAARALGCHSIQVDTASAGSPGEQRKHLAAGLSSLCDYAQQQRINVLLTNDGAAAGPGWLLALLKDVNRECCGALPCFDEFENQRRYDAFARLVRVAKGVCAKALEFDEQGNETHTDYERLLKIVRDAGYRGYVGIEYQGAELSEEKGILATKDLLTRVRSRLAASPR